MRYALVCVISVTLMFAPSAGAQSGLPDGIVDPARNNFQHPDGTTTAELGALGGVKMLGSGPIDLILLPGPAFSGEVWKSFMERNAERYTMHAITPAGYGGTPPPPMPPGEDFEQRAWSDALCNAIVALIREKNLDRPLIVGHHMLGDYYALRIGLEQAELVRGVVVVAGRISQRYAMGPDANGGVRVAEGAARKQIVDGGWRPFYQRVTPKMWRLGSFAPVTFCRDAARARALWEEMVSVPMPTQIRYFLEYIYDDLTPRLADLKCPLLVVEPRLNYTLDELIGHNAEMNVMFSGSIEAARAQWAANFTTSCGSVEAGLKFNSNSDQWESMRDKLPRMRLEYVEGTGTFVMEDQPERLDALIADFLAREAR